MEDQTKEAPETPVGEVTAAMVDNEALPEAGAEAAPDAAQESPTEATWQASADADALDVSDFVEDKQGPSEEEQLKTLIATILYVTGDPMTPAQLAQGLSRDVELVDRLITELMAFYEDARFGFQIHSKAGGYYMGTKPEFDETLRQFFDSQKQPLKLSQPALETLCIIAYKQPITAPEIAQIRGTQGVGRLKPLLDRKLITTAGRKDVVGKPVLYKTTPEFLIQFGLKDLKELPTLKEFEELRRLAIEDDMIPPAEAKAPQTETNPVASEQPVEESNPDEAAEASGSA